MNLSFAAAMTDAGTACGHSSIGGQIKRMIHQITI
jgi:hypothetical protein